MKRYWTVLCASFRCSVKNVLAYPKDLLFQMISLPVDVFASFLTIFVVAGNTLLDGWDFTALIALGGTHMLLGGIVNAFVEPNLSYFGDRVLNGSLDDLLTMPVHALFSATLLRQSPVQLLSAFAGLIAVILGGIMARASALGWFLYVFSLPVSLLLAWALRTILASACFFFRGSDLTVVYSAIWQFQRYPVGIYPIFLRAAMYALPFALIAMPPVLCLTAANPAQFLLEFGASCLLTPLAFRLWKAGTKRYVSATS